MKFRKGNFNIWEVLIEEEWYFLCACENCKEIHVGKNLIEVDDKIKCCEQPNNWTCGKDDKIDYQIDEFVKKWSD